MSMYFCGKFNSNKVNIFKKSKSYKNHSPFARMSKAGKQSAFKLLFTVIHTKKLFHTKIYYFKCIDINQAQK